MASASEAMGMTLPGSSSFPAESAEKLAECDSIGEVMRNMLENDILPRDIITREALENAMVRVFFPSIRMRLTFILEATGLDDGFGRIDERCASLDRYRPFRRNHLDDRRRSSGL